MTSKFIIAYSNPVYEGLFQSLKNRFGNRIQAATHSDQLTVERVQEIRPDYIFFPHWSAILKKEIYEHYNCVMFHMTDLPFGRGGSPLQNLIVRGIQETKISAFKCEKGVDTGPIYLKKPLKLNGSAREIFFRASEVIETMILDIIEKSPIPVPQTGEHSSFTRRKPDEGNIAPLSSIESIYDYIRMLDADGYPHAFLEMGPVTLTFTNASLNNDELTASVVFKRNQK